MASFDRKEGDIPVAKVLLTMEGKIKLKFSYIEVISSVVTEIVGKNTEDEESC